MLKLDRTLLPAALAVLGLTGIRAQTLQLRDIFHHIRSSHPVVGMYDNEIRSMDASAKGARSWMAPQLGIGQFMTPYDARLWHREGDIPGMGSIMVSGEQMLPDKRRLDAAERYMGSMSAVESEKKKASLNELVNDAKGYYYEWIVLKKKLLTLEENERILRFMLKNEESRFSNAMERLNAYYKAKAALGENESMRTMVEAEIRDKRIRLNALMGRDARTPFEIDTAYTLTDYSSTVFDSSLLQDRRSDLKSLDREIDVLKWKQDTEKASLRPEFGVRYDNMFGFGGQPMQYSIMGMVRIPMARWSSKMNKANLESLAWKTRAVKSQQKMMVNELTAMAYAMANEHALKRRQLDIYQETVLPALTAVYRTLRLAYEQNTRDMIMLFEAWDAVNMKTLQYLEVLNQALKLQVEIDRIIEKS